MCLLNYGFPVSHDIVAVTLQKVLKVKHYAFFTVNYCNTNSKTANGKFGGQCTHFVIYVTSCVAAMIDSLRITALQ